MIAKATIWFVPVAALLLGDAAATRFDRVVAALQAGQAAEAIGGHRQAATLRAAAVTLVVAGATPAAGSEDLAEHWQSVAARSDSNGAPVAAYRNRALGPAYRTVNLPGGGKAVFDQVFLAGQRARVSVVPVNKSGFQLTVDDDDNRAVCTNAAVGNRCEWIPSWTTRFRVNLVNPGVGAGVYYLVVQ